MAFKPKPIDQDDLEAPRFPDSKVVAIFDGDDIHFKCAAAGEKRSIKVTHKKSGGSQEFTNRTEFWGRSKKTLGGWLGQTNKVREEQGKKPFVPDDFEIEDIQTPEPLENVLHSVRSMVRTRLDHLKTDKFEMYLGSGPSYRINQSTMMQYKGNREEKIKPLYFQEVFDYMVEKYDATIVRGIETDDAVIIRAFGDPDAIVVGRDKDACSQPVKNFNPDRVDMGVIDGDCFGKLWIEGSGSKEKVRGYGRLHLLFQMISEDDADNYKFNCHSDVKWAAKSAYKVLVNCKTDQEAWNAVVEVAKRLYPEPKVVKSWRGNEFLLDWYRALEEQFNMARMKTSENDFTTLEDWLIQHEITYTYNEPEEEVKEAA